MATFAPQPPESTLREQPVEQEQKQEQPHQQQQAPMHNQQSAAIENGVHAAEHVNGFSAPSAYSNGVAPASKAIDLAPTASETKPAAPVSIADLLSPPEPAPPAAQPAVTLPSNSLPTAQSDPISADNQTSSDEAPSKLASTTPASIDAAPAASLPESSLQAAAAEQSTPGPASAPVEPSAEAAVTDEPSPRTIEPAADTAIISEPPVPEFVGASAETPAEPAPTPALPAPDSREPSTEPTPIDSKMDVDTTNPATVKVSRERDDEEDEPVAKRAKLEDDAPVASPSTASVPAISTPIVATSTMPASALDSAPSTAPVPAATAAPEPVNALPSLPAVAAPTAVVPPAISGDFGPMTDHIQKRLMEGMRNLRKSKSSPAFTKPVDWQALNLPTYPDIIKEPMDLSTMEHKLKSQLYESVNDYVRDFNLMVRNSITFNGPQHPVAQAAMNLQSAFQAQLKKLPAPGEAPPAPQTVAKPRPSLNSMPPSTEKKRRESRPSTGGAQSPINTFAAPNGVPTIRRDSTVGNRPKREIHRPPPRDLPYAGSKPRKKKFQAELQFCGEVLADLKRPRYQQYLAIFAEPVDPVALNIPTYRKIVKNPMDLSTITQKFDNNEYQTAKEFEKDWQLMFNNCYKFNGNDHPVTKVAKEYEHYFNEEMAKKDAWIATHAPPSAAQSPAADSDFDSSEDEDSEDEAETLRSQQIAQMHAQIAALQAQTASLMAAYPKKEKTVSKKKEKSSKKRKSMSSSKDKKSKSSKTSKPRPITARDKEEIVAKIGELDAAAMGRAAEMIKMSFRRAGRHDLADKPDDDLEFDIDVIPEDGLQGLLRLVREVVPTALPSRESLSTPSNKQYAPGSKHKKSKPMSGREQQEAVNRLDQQIAGFESGGNDNSDQRADSSDDEDSESGSESEEE